MHKAPSLNGIFEVVPWPLFPRFQTGPIGAYAPTFGFHAPNCAPEDCRNVAHLHGRYRTTQASIQGVFKGEKKKAARLWNDAAL